MRWLELSIEADVEAVESVSEILGRVAEGTAVHPARLLRDPDDELAARPDPDAPFVVTAHLADDGASAAAIDATERALWHLQAFALRPLGALRVRSVDDAAWNEAWKEHYIAQRIGRVVIVPSWTEEPLRSGEVAIILDPGMAFGTGLHPTTRGCLALLQEIEPMPDVVLDVGCGSGVLAIAALRLGAGRADGLDTDPLAVEATRANAECNGVGDRVRVGHGTLPEAPIERYPLVVANLVAAVLIELAPRLAAHLAVGGLLVASGIIEPRAAEVVSALSEAGLALEERRDDGEWVSLLLRGSST
ncbi:MAG: 50S ribosomal protein L11 methyltransferase [Candidatus Limnocylindria bacterium]